MQSSSINPQGSSKKIMSIIVTLTTTCQALVTKPIAGYLHYKKSDDLNLFSMILFPWRGFPDRHTHLSCGGKMVSIYSYCSCDEKFTSFGCVLSVTPLSSSISSSHLSPTHLSWFLQSESMSKDINILLYSHFSQVLLAGLPASSNHF